MRTSHHISRRAALTALAATVVGGATAARATAAPPPRAGAAGSALAPVRMMPLGDSITDGFNVPGGYRVDLWQKFLAGGSAG